MESPKGLRLVEKTVEVLNLLSEYEELTIAGLAEYTGEPRSSLYRLLRRLEQLELVEPGNSRGYFRLGTHLLRWGSAAQTGMNVRKRALPIMDQIRTKTGLTVYLVVRRGWRSVCIERVEGTRVASLLLQVGGSLPLHIGASPRALLANEPVEVWQEYVDQAELNRMTDKTPGTPHDLFEVLSKEQAQGYSLSDGHVTLGIASLGAPIFDHRGAVHAALSVSGLRDEVLGPDAEIVRSLVIDGAAAASRAMGYSPGPLGGRSNRSSSKSVPPGSLDI